jgi:hypothetical protein
MDRTYHPNGGKMFYALVATGVVAFLARIHTEQDPRPPRWWVGWSAVALLAVASFITTLVVTAWPAWVALSLVGATLATGTYLREILRGIGSWLASPKHLVQLVLILVGAYIGLLAVVNEPFRASLFSLVLAASALWLMIGGLFRSLKPKKKK